jgi:cyclophilin family peptidyl-prolyl cis-trans isomerase
MVTLQKIHSILDKLLAITTTTTTIFKTIATMQWMRSEGRNEPILPQHVLRSSSETSLPAGDISSCDDSSTESTTWLSPKMTYDSDKYSLPTWSANPQSPGSDRCSIPVRSFSKKTSSFIASHPQRIPLLLIGFVLIGIVAIVAPQMTLNQAATQIASFQNHRDEIQSKLSKYEQDIINLEREMNSLDFALHKQQLGLISSETPSSSSSQLSGERHEQKLSEMSELQHRLHNELSQSQYLKKQVQETSRNATIEKYGSNGHFVEIQLIFPESNDGPTTFTIEMAPIDVMPHSVHTFLEMVSIGLLDGCSFILSALQVVKAAPLSYDGTSSADKAKAFSEHGLESVSFKEYSDTYPHKKYTVGFAADGSPSFYINTADNSEIHVGDPCFGKIVSGYDTIDRLANSPTRNGIWFQHRIGIQSARIVQHQR